MFSLFSVAYYRVRGPIGYWNTLKVLEARKINEFTSNRGINVLIYADDNDDLDFAESGIRDYEKRINFARTQTKFASSFSCKSFPCIEAYVDGTKVPDNAPLVPIGFQDWLLKLTRPPIVEVIHPEQLRRILIAPGSVIFGVDIKERPESMRSFDTFYTCKSQFFESLGTKLQKGIYVYRSADHTIIKVEKNFQNYMKTPIVNPMEINISTRPYVAGYFISDSSQDDAEKEMDILRTLASTFKDVYFFPFSSGLGAVFQEIGRIGYIAPPVFAVFNSTQEKGPRYLVNGNKIHDVKYLKQFISDILEGKQPPTYISEAKDKSDKYQLTYNELNGIIEKHDTDIVITYTSPAMSRGEFFDKFAKVADSLIKASSIKFYVYNLSANEIPDFHNFFDDPIIEFYPKGSNKPVYFTKTPDIQTFVNWVIETSTEKPKYDAFNAHEVTQKYLPPIDAIGEMVAEEHEEYEYEDYPPEPTQDEL